MDKALKLTTVAVLMPVFNAEKYLKEAIDSILNQTYSDFEFFIINDGSTDNSEKIILGYKDCRIRYFNNEINKGLIYTLNKGLDLINADYIVRMDADDISFCNRIEIQKNFMEQNPNIWVCGSQVQYFGESNKISNYFISHDEIKAQLLFSCGIAHPSVIIRTQNFKAHNFRYDSSYLHLEDYELWTRVSKYGELANLPQVLLKYRAEGQNISIKNWSTREERLKWIYKKTLKELEIEPDLENLQLHLELGGNTKNIRNVISIKRFSNKLLEQNNKKKIYNRQTIESYTQVLWRQLFFKVVDKGISETFKYWIQSRWINWKQFVYFFKFNINYILSQKK